MIFRIQSFQRVTGVPVAKIGWGGRMGFGHPGLVLRTPASPSPQKSHPATFAEPPAGRLGVRAKAHERSVLRPGIDSKPPLLLILGDQKTNSGSNQNQGSVAAKENGNSKIEAQQQNQYGLNEYIRTGDKYILHLLGHFAREYQDGRSSFTMVELLDRVRGNPRIQILAFDPDFSMDGQDRDTKMAQNLIKAIENQPHKKIVILAGNVHSATKIGNFFDPNYRPMAFQLSALAKSPIKSSDVLSIMTRYENASIWACTNDNAADCGPMKFNKDTSEYSTAVAFDSYFLIEPTMSSEGYLATWFTRTVEISLPFQ